MPRLLALMTLCAALLAGCQTGKDSVPAPTRIDFEGREDFAFAPTLRVRVLADGEPTHGGALRDVVQDGLPEAYAKLFSLELDADPELYFGGEFEYWTTQGRWTQDVAAGERLDPHGTQNLDGPGTWENEIQLHLFMAGLHGGASFMDLLVVDGTIGVNVQGALVDIDEIDGVQYRNVSEDIWRVGLSFGGTVGVTPLVEWFMVYARFMGHYGASDEHPTWLSTTELGAELTVFPGVSIFAAYRWTNYIADRDDDESHKDSDYDLRLEGPVAGLQLTF